jgi:hypothetical protein
MASLPCPPVMLHHEFLSRMEEVQEEFDVYYDHCVPVLELAVMYALEYKLLYALSLFNVHADLPLPPGFEQAQSFFWRVVNRRVAVYNLITGPFLPPGRCVPAGPVIAGAVDAVSTDAVMLFCAEPPYSLQAVWESAMPSTLFERFYPSFDYDPDEESGCESDSEDSLCGTEDAETDDEFADLPFRLR